MDFNSFGFDSRLMEGIDASGYEEPTPVQQQVIPHIMNGKDVIAFAQTGTGKTAAFLLPLIHRIITHPHDSHTINALIIVPTRELAIQISQHLEGLSYFADISSIPVYGGGDGQSFVQERKALSTGADIVVCTPGKMMAHIKMGYVKLDGLKYLVLDEADRMLDMGFYDDIMFIIRHLPERRQNLLFSATMPPRIQQMARQILHQPEVISIAISKPPERIKQLAFIVYDTQKIPLTLHLLKDQTFKTILIFCSSKQSVKRLTRDLRSYKLKADEIHSDLTQEKREDVLMNFKSGRVPILVATDILSRGIDIDNIDLVVNFDAPHDGEDYVHRIGRTARAEADGTAYTLVGLKDQRKLMAIERLLGNPIPKGTVPPQLGEVPEYKPGSSARSQNRRPQSKSGNKNRGGAGGHQNHRRN